MFSAATSVADWAGFFSAEVGASASLAGLVMVAISINLAQIIAYPSLPGRAIETLAMLVGVLLVASSGLVPGRSLGLLGWEIALIGAVMWLIGVWTYWSSRTFPFPGKRWARPLRIAMGQFASLPFVAAGIAMQFYGAIGLYWILPGTLFCLFAGVMNAWVLLVEIVR